MNAVGNGGEAQPLTVPASLSERRDEPSPYVTVLREQPTIDVTIHNPRVGKIREWQREGKRYFTINLGWHITVFVDDIEEFIDQLIEAYENKEVVRE